IGHARTYTITDIMARFYRLLGYSVLFPMGFHVTGTPIISMSDRIKEGDKELFEIFEKIYEMKREIYTKLTDPRDLIMFFAKEIEEGMVMMGYMIDWTRKFYTSDPHFEKFIEWHMKKLYNKGYLIKGKHPIPYSPKLNSSVGAHDTKGDIDPEIEEYTGIKFKTDYGILIAATLRPETIYGITNLWVRADELYIRIKIEDEIFIFSLKAWERLKYQFNNYEELEYIKGEKLLNLVSYAPIINKTIPIYHGEIVKPEEGTGIVMSVPAHSVYDYHEYKKLNKEYPIIILVKNKPSNAKDYYKDNIEAANKELYMLEYNEGYHVPLNVSVKQARELTKAKLKQELQAINIYKIANGPIYSRSGD
ncbi:MAG: class I tRNA ligase family protein, partial [bacterium]